jgi:elongation factor 1-beta
MSLELNPSTWTSNRRSSTHRVRLSNPVSKFPLTMTLMYHARDDETDMVDLEANLGKIEVPGLVWGLSKLVAVGYGIFKCTIVIEDQVSQ